MEEILQRFAALAAPAESPDSSLSAALLPAAAPAAPFSPTGSGRGATEDRRPLPASAASAFSSSAAPAQTARSNGTTRAHDETPADLFVALIDCLRPRDADDTESARRSLQALCFLLGERPALRAGMRSAIRELSQSHRHSELYAASGILPNTGFFSEAFRRIGHKLLPDVPDPGLLRSVLRRVFHRPDDFRWVCGAGEDAWLHVVDALRFGEDAAAAPSATPPRAHSEMQHSLRVVSTWIAALGSEPELLRLIPSLADAATAQSHQSPFIAQNGELLAYLDRLASGPSGEGLAADADDRHLRVLLDQCRDVIARVRRRAARQGASIRLTYHLQRLEQLIGRAEQLLDIVTVWHADPSGHSAQAPIVRLFMQRVADECQRDALRPHWRQNVELLSLRVTENAGHHGEHYITETRGEYLAMARSAMIGGFIIAFMACIKLVLAKAGMPPATGALAFCLNYGLGFCLIHILHGAVATKQPAMTANAIAARISQSGGKVRDIEALTALIASTVRSQIVAILGNIGVAIPLAAFLAIAFVTVTGTPLADADKSMHLLEEQSLIKSGAVFYAAIAGVCLFLAGLISGYFDNYAAYNRIPERLLQLAWPRRLLGEARMQRVARYIGDNLGALAGNLTFGFLLGGTTIIGVLFGLPLDIRHVAFSSAFIGIATVGTGFAPDAWTLVWAVLGVVAIGTANLLVSFALALNVALRARQVSDAQWRLIGASLARHLARQPRDFFLPPKARAPHET
ncbi:preprotein translocase subunit TatB [Rhodocyclus tenuis]|uniref:site-specific recombinase n=1 Tax=Rhodocyclus gracilis TaxID=2929842 RepID=UPI001298B4A9|nr:site-specific recombinase [Rhodocyclus gracilis]MRD73604.1 preprotein translocase subunit TatB [Rhodocyclus gracilis]